MRCICTGTTEKVGGKMKRSVSLGNVTPLLGIASGLNQNDFETRSFGGTHVRL